ncbi:chemotaxis-specific protein-glutamate methyltransferase CheB [Lachnobacterium bovis]|uniref:Protein-glutamate methylesterase/protein-glutamine glutaminase n=1 Tax=Lachnobacterium bovis TaxID=140626 RepID=A0A1H9Q4I2_9FIRM|nr:chemotaxis-specific protein-glutamate methyltransferase CheB [Lachnobacterium bovis]SER55354.1 two-component system, chemotaxis family, response regulator CheB [Lachnobacterium bovis]
MKKNILVIDDSALLRRVMCDIINSDSNFQVVDTCKDGVEGYEKLKNNTFDGVILDVNMPKMSGLELLEKLKKDGIKAKIIVVSTVSRADSQVTIKALELGAIDFVEKPSNIIEAKGEDFKNRLITILNTSFYGSSAGRVRRKNNVQAPVTPPNRQVRPVDPKIERFRPVEVSKTSNNRKIKPSKGAKNTLVAIACSTGGPKALQRVVPYIPSGLEAPVVIVQHMPKGFTKSLAERLNEISKVKVKEAENGEILKKGVVYIAPGGNHLEIKKVSDTSHKIAFNDMPAIGGLKPCANVMYDSLITSGYDKIVCVVLTGMGADGTAGITSLASKKPVYIISQNEQTCVVYGMPRAIALTGLVDEIVPLGEVANSITKNVGVE